MVKSVETKKRGKLTAMDAKWIRKNINILKEISMDAAIEIGFLMLLLKNKVSAF